MRCAFQVCLWWPTYDRDVGDAIWRRRLCGHIPQQSWQWLHTSIRSLHPGHNCQEKPASMGHVAHQQLLILLSCQIGMWSRFGNSLEDRATVDFIKWAAGTWLNSLGPSGAIWRQRSGSTLAQVMACCLTAPSHYLNQFWLILSKVQWHSSDGNFTRDTPGEIHQPSITKCSLKITLSKISVKSRRGQWVKDRQPV